MCFFPKQDRDSASQKPTEVMCVCVFVCVCLHSYVYMKKHGQHACWKAQSYEIAVFGSKRGIADMQTR